MTSYMLLSLLSMWENNCVGLKRVGRLLKYKETRRNRKCMILSNLPWKSTTKQFFFYFKIFFSLISHFELFFKVGMRNWIRIHPHCWDALNLINSHVENIKAMKKKRIQKLYISAFVKITKTSDSYTKLIIFSKLCPLIYAF